jgi:hypothetical protein
MPEAAGAYSAPRTHRMDLEAELQPELHDAGAFQLLATALGAILS